MGLWGHFRVVMTREWQTAVPSKAESDFIARPSVIDYVILSIHCEIHVGAGKLVLPVRYLLGEPTAQASVPRHRAPDWRDCPLRRREKASIQAGPEKIAVITLE